jgi:hypothetical protein
MMFLLEQREDWEPPQEDQAVCVLASSCNNVFVLESFMERKNVTFCAGKKTVVEEKEEEEEEKQKEEEGAEEEEEEEEEKG